MQQIPFLLTLMWLLAFPTFVSANSDLQWQELTKQDNIKPVIADGASMAQQQNLLLVLPGEVDTTNAKPVYLYSHNKLKQLSLDEAQGNRAFASTTTYADKIIVVGGLEDGKNSAKVSWLQVDSAQKMIASGHFPPLPVATRQSAAVVFDNALFVLAVQQQNLHFLRLTLNADGEAMQWQKLDAPQLTGAIQQLSLAVQNDSRGDKIYAQIVTDHAGLWRYQPGQNMAEPWQQLQTLNPPKGPLISLHPLGQSHLLAISPTGESYHYNTITRAWAKYQYLGQSPTAIQASQLLLQQLFVVNKTEDGSHLVQASLAAKGQEFGVLNMTVLVLYLIAVVALGVFFMSKNNNTNDFFRGGQSIPWWAAACSIYATMLSSLTYMALPAMVYQSDWVLLFGILTIVLVAPIAVYVAVPFFRQIDATSAYEYLSKRFNMQVRLFASALFTLFHLSRMGVVMALTALALAAITPLTATESVLLMGVLCLVYCTLGGIEAVIWTDTLQTVVLLLGAVVCFVTIIMNVDGGIGHFVSVGLADDKFTLLNVDFSASSITSLSIWVIVLGGIGQNLSSYTADQAIVQRYMVTPDPEAAKKSIWTNAFIAAPASVLFFCIGTGLYVFYQAHPEQLNPGQQIDQIFPTFIATQMPAGLAGLIVAGIFAAAQSTVSTSINSIATTLVTDFVRPFEWVKTEQGYMRCAQWLTGITGVLGTLIGLIFIDPKIRSLMDAYFMIIGMFMGALGGLFVLGVVTKKANTVGAIAGLLGGVAIMMLCWLMELANGYLYCSIGIVSCVVIGYAVSLLFPSANKNVVGLTLYTMNKPAATSNVEPV